MADLIIQPKNDDHLKLNNDAGTTILELANDESKLRLAQNNISASDGTTAITTSGANVTLAGSANNIGTAGGTFNGTIATSNANFPSGTVFYLGTNSTISSGASDNSTSGYTNSGLAITLSDVSAYSKVVLHVSYSFSPDGASYDVTRYRLQRTAPSDSTIYFVDQVGNFGNSVIPYITAPALGADESLGSGSHTYRIQYIRIYSNTVLPLGISGNESSIVAYGVV